MVGMVSTPFIRGLMQPPLVMWRTLSGRTFPFSVYDTRAYWPDGSAIYVFGKLIGSQWIALYIGEAENLRVRLTNHKKWASAAALGMNCIHVHWHNGTEARRKADEADLIQAYRPVLNIQHNAGLAGLANMLANRPSR